MSDAEFLTKLKLMRDGKLTNAAMLSLGDSQYDCVFDVPSQVMWRLYDANGLDKDYKIFFFHHQSHRVSMPKPNISATEDLMINTIKT